MPLVDAEDIGPDDEIWRRIPPAPGRQLTYEHDENRWRPSSAAFQDSDGPDDPLSALLGREDTAERALAGKWSGFFLASVSAGLLRSHQQGIARGPTAEDANHLLIFGRKTHSRRQRWAKSARWIVGPDLPPPP